jgi:hypothetical protein
MTANGAIEVSPNFQWKSGVSLRKSQPSHRSVKGEMPDYDELLEQIATADYDE